MRELIKRKYHKIKSMFMPLSLNERIELNRYRVMGPPCVVEGQLRHMSSIVDAWRGLGHPDEISKALDDASDVIQQYKQFGTINQVRSIYDQMIWLMETDTIKESSFTQEEKDALDQFIQYNSKRIKNDRAQNPT